MVLPSTIHEGWDAARLSNDVSDEIDSRGHPEQDHRKTVDHRPHVVCQRDDSVEQSEANAQQNGRPERVGRLDDVPRLKRDVHGPGDGDEQQRPGRGEDPVRRVPGRPAQLPVPGIRREKGAAGRRERTGQHEAQQGEGVAPYLS